ncbi:hypothetical protein JTB14_033675 [Gonioctena quinquepunctata]|nr:hypothetical protein JTB14_033675 [Gonioctena quinquepunctata]
MFSLELAAASEGRTTFYQQRFAAESIVSSPWCPEMTKGVIGRGRVQNIEIKLQHEEIKHQIEDIKRHLIAIKQQYRIEIENLKEELSSLKEENVRLKEKSKKIERIVKKYNIVVYGVKEEKNESTPDEFVEL